ncbi:MAG: hypothetical protein UR68_C0003G0018 [Candidatus Roizmanbacteria bacterium GW2011_GWA2_35_19]|uniref:DNA recombination protein RmuC n=1 Tax=Candidatus Roizmanbacteria bacterium GW2011_GWA2_35_19 TaxID=1618478 RepID=A0A0G0BWV4_9BACT|nr:MAG: hypothetical protein UR68_C0003G0018 [Candidatus Roizmanbacteria bacterium GW2011_GWA2_35_19]
MTLTLIVAISFFIVTLMIIRFWLNRLEEKSKISSELVEWLKTSNTANDERLSTQMNTFNTRLDKAAYVIAQDLLKQYFPKDSYKLQYTFKNGEKVDAVIVTSNGMIPIDSKFPLENFKKYLKADDPKEKIDYKKLFVSDVKKHISDIAKKYILPDEKTVDYALMYIPSENVYYEIISTDEIFDYAGSHMVLPVSPMSFYAYIKAILMSFEGQKIEEKAKQVITLLSAIKKDYQTNLLSDKQEKVLE